MKPSHPHRLQFLRLKTQRDLAEWAREQSPPVAVLFTSGHARDMLSGNHLLSPDIHLLSKPYGPDVLARRVRSVLTSRMITAH
jgi:DNA-binding response OmpR family regulator